MKSGKAGLNGAQTKERRVVYEWGSPTYEPDHALDDCVMLQDNSGVMTLVQQRKTSDLSNYEEYSKIDTSFGVSVKVMKSIETDFKWKKSSTYHYEVEFFPRPR